MRVSSARCAFIVLTLVGLAGCNCCDRWAMPACSMPDLAFWKSSPFKASSDATGLPERPSALASRPTMPGPGAGYATGSTTAPPYVENTAGTTLPGSYPTTQQANWSIPSSPYSSAGATVSSSSPYVAPQAGAYGMQDSVSPGGTSPAVSASSYTRTAATPYGPLRNSQDTAAGSSYIPAPATAPYTGSAETTLPYGGGSAGDSSAVNGYRSRLDRFNSRFDRNKSAFDRQATGFDRSQSGADPYRPPAAGSATTAAGLTSGQYGSTAPASDYRGSTASPYAGATSSSNSSPYVANPHDRYPTVHSGAGSTTGGGYYSPPAASQQPGVAATPTASSLEAAGRYNLPASSYVPGASSYVPGNTGYTPPGVSPYQSPATSSTLPASNPDDPPPYRPGSTTDYVPLNPGATAPSSTPGTSVAPAGYAPPVGGLP